MSTVVTVFCQSCNREIVSSPLTLPPPPTAAGAIFLRDICSWWHTVTVTQDQNQDQEIGNRNRYTYSAHTSTRAIFRRLGFDWPALLSRWLSFSLLLLLVCCLFHFCFLPVYFLASCSISTCIWQNRTTSVIFYENDFPLQYPGRGILWELFLRRKKWWFWHKIKQSAAEGK